MYPSHGRHYRPLFPFCPFSSQIFQALEFHRTEVIKYFFRQDAFKLEQDGRGKNAGVGCSPGAKVQF